MSLDLSVPGVVRNGKWSLELSPTRFDVLQAIASASTGIAVSEEQIERAVYGRHVPHESRIVHVHICHLRRLLKGSGWTIETRWGFGWYLKPESDAQAST